MRRYLVVANQTLAGPELAALVRERAAAGPSEFWVVVPATPLTHTVDAGYLAMPVMGAIPSVPGPPEEAEEVARAKLDAALRRFRESGATVDGEVGEPDPVRAVQNALAGREIDEIIVSTLPTRLSRWLRQDLPTRLEHRFHLPVTHVPSRSIDPEPAAGAADR